MFKWPATQAGHDPDIGEIDYPYVFGLIDALGYSGGVGCAYQRAATG
jgi:2-dehydrotetronate isomerase